MNYSLVTSLHILGLPTKLNPKLSSSTSQHIHILNVQQRFFRTRLNIFDAKGDVDIKAYQKLTDSIFEEILWSTDVMLKQARDTLKKILKREIYKCVGQTCPPPDTINKKVH